MQKDELVPCCPAARMPRVPQELVPRAKHAATEVAGEIRGVSAAPCSPCSPCSSFQRLKPQRPTLRWAALEHRGRARVAASPWKAHGERDATSANAKAHATDAIAIAGDEGHPRVAASCQRGQPTCCCSNIFTRDFPTDSTDAWCTACAGPCACGCIRNTRQHSQPMGWKGSASSPCAEVAAALQNGMTFSAFSSVNRGQCSKAVLPTT